MTWQPGDPIYRRPSIMHDGDQWLRQIIEIHDDGGGSAAVEQADPIQPDPTMRTPWAWLTPETSRSTA